MLILNRARGQSLIIGHNIKLTILNVNNKTTAIGIDAPRHIPVHRLEIYDSLMANGEYSQSMHTKACDVLACASINNADLDEVLSAALNYYFRHHSDCPINDQDERSKWIDYKIESAIQLVASQLIDDVF